MNNYNRKATEITIIAIGIAALIGGGFFILQLSMVFPIPGVKYIMMSPFISLVIFILLYRLSSIYAILKIGLVFAAIMMLINLFMGAAIITTALMTQLTILPIKSHKIRAYLGAVCFSGYTGLSALTFSKYLIGGIFSEIPLAWLVLTGVICLLFGGLGVLIANRLMKYMRGI